MTHDLQPESRLPLQFHVLSFEGPDAYAQAGGIGSRITGLTLETYAPIRTGSGL